MQKVICKLLLFSTLFTTVGCSNLNFPYTISITRKVEKPPKPKHLVHIVKYKGETLGQISKWYTGSTNNWTVLKTHNYSIDENRIKIGEKILIPYYLLSNTQPLPQSAIKNNSSTNTTKCEILCRKANAEVADKKVRIPEIPEIINSIKKEKVSTSKTKNSSPVTAQLIDDEVAKHESMSEERAELLEDLLNESIIATTIESEQSNPKAETALPENPTTTTVTTTTTAPQTK